MLKSLVHQMLDLPFRIVNSKQFTVGDRSSVRYRRVRLRRGSSVTIGEGSAVEANVYFDRDDGELIVGDRTSIGRSMLAIAERVIVGSDVLISWGCTIVDHNSHSLTFDERKNDVTDWIQGRKDWTNVRTAPVTIEDKVWIGLNCIVLRGVRIGEGAVVGAGSIVTRDVLPWTVVAGNPAKVIKVIPVQDSV